MSTIGTLNFLIGGDDKELRKIFEARKKDAEELQRLFSDIKIGSASTANTNKQFAESVKQQEQKNRLQASYARTATTMARMNEAVRLSEERVNNERERGIGIRRNNARLEEQRRTGEIKRIEAEEKAEAKRQERQANALTSSMIAEDRLDTHITNSLNNRIRQEERSERERQITKKKVDAEDEKREAQKQRRLAAQSRARQTIEREATNSLLNEDRVNHSIKKGINLDTQQLKLKEQIRTEGEKQLTQQRQQNLAAARTISIESERAAKQKMNNQRLLTEIQRTEIAKKRAAMAGISLQRNLERNAQFTNKTLFNQRVLLQQLSTQLGVYFSIYQVGRFVKELAMVSGEFEKQRLALSAILQNKEAANKIFLQIKDLAVYSPFDFSELTDYAKQLSAYSIPANELFDTMKRLADVSAGLGVDMRRIILAYGQIRSAAFLRGQEVRQLTEAGIPIIDDLAKKFSVLENRMVSAGEVFDKISRREVPFAMIKEIFWDLTSEGGKFFEMQEIQAKSLAGMISNLRDAYDIMLDSIGEANRGLLKGSVSSMVHVMDNWERYWGILKGIIVTYGTYKATVFAVTAGMKSYAKMQVLNRFLAIQSIQSGTKLAAVLDMLTLKFANLSRASKIGLVVAAIAGIAYAVMKVVESANKLNRELDKIMGKVKADADASVISLENLMIRLRGTNEYSAEYRNIIQQINKQYGDFLPNLINEAESLEVIEEKLKGVTAAIYEKAKAQSYSESLQVIESDLSDKMSKAYDSAVQSLTSKNFMGYGQLMLTKEEANKVVSDMFAAIRTSPELYKNVRAVEKLITDTMVEAYKGQTDLILSFEDLKQYSQLDGLVKGVKSYSKAVSGVPDLLDEMYQKKEALFGLNSTYAQSIENIQIKYQELNAELQKDPNVDSLFIERSEFENNKRMLEEMIAVYKEYGQYNLARETESKLKELLSLGQGWRAELNKAFNSTINIAFDTNFNDVIDEMKKKYKDIKTRMDDNKPILMKLGFDFDENRFPTPLEITDSMKQLAESFKLDEKDRQNIERGAKLLGMTLEDLYSPKEKGSPKDRFTEDLKRQVDLIRDAKKQYEELKQIMSPEKAFTSLTSVDEYKGVKLENITDEGYVKYLREQLAKVENRNSDTAKNVRVAWNKELGSIQIDTITKHAESELKRIEKYLSRYKDKYNLYEQIFNLTGDKGKAAEVAFGDSRATVESYIDVMKRELEGMSGGGVFEELLLQDRTKLPKEVARLVDEIERSIQEKDFALKVDMSTVMAEYATLQEKITAIHNRYEKKREEARKNSKSEEDVSPVLAAYDRAEAEEVKALQMELLQLTPFYRQLFGDLSDISYRHLKRMVADAKGIVDTIANAKNEDGSLTYGKYDRNNRLEGYFMPNEDGSISDTFIHLKEYEKILRKIASLQKDMRKDNPFASLIRPKEEYQFADGEQMSNVDIFASKLSDANTIVQDMTGGLSGMLDALGAGDAADTVAFVGEMMTSVSDIGMGIMSMNPGQVLQGIVSGITSIAKQHDAKLDKAIKKSQLEVKKLKGVYEDIEKVISRQLVAVTEQQAKQQIKNLEKQRSEIYSQIRNEQDKKKSDDSVIQDYRQQIRELDDQIRYFYEDLASSQFGIQIKDWAKTIADSLVDAWSKGEDAAEAFDKTVADIMKNVFKNMLQLQYIAPAMERLRKYLFGNDGKGGILGDGVMSQHDMAGLVKELAVMKGSIGDWKKAWDYLVDAAKQAGIDLEEMTSADTLSKGIASVTEDTANLLASYINAMRGDLSVQRGFVQRIMQFAESNSSVFALMQAEIVRIQINTLATANNTKKLVEISEDTNTILKRASLSGSGVRFNVV